MIDAERYAQAVDIGGLMVGNWDRPSFYAALYKGDAIATVASPTNILRTMYRITVWPSVCTGAPL